MKEKARREACGIPPQPALYTFENIHSKHYYYNIECVSDCLQCFQSEHESQIDWAFRVRTLLMNGSLQNLFNSLNKQVDVILKIVSVVLITTFWTWRCGSSGRATWLTNVRP
jgi:hypothetical protein